MRNLSREPKAGRARASATVASNLTTDEQQPTGKVSLSGIFTRLRDGEPKEERVGGWWTLDMGA
jgi:hypothetical protein